MELSLKWKKRIPWILVLSRVFFAPVAIGLAICQLPAWMWMVQFLLAVMSDWLDGKFARRWGTVTAGLRQADSIADTVYTVGVIISLWLMHRNVILAHIFGIIAVLSLEVLRYPMDWWIFGRSASYHALSAKLFGISILVSVSLLVGFNYVGPVFWIMLAIGIISELEGILISFILPVWTHDVKGFWVALKIRKDYKQKK